MKIVSGAIPEARGLAALRVAFRRQIGPTRPRFGGRVVGLYYALRGFSVAGAAALGGLLWSVRPSLTFLVAALLGVLGTLGAAIFLPRAPTAERC